MSDFTPKPGSGALFKNEYKTADNHPGMKGYVIAHRDIKMGERLELASWKKEGGKGPFMSLKMQDSKPKGDAEPNEQRGGQAREDSGDLSDEIPFSLWGDKHEKDVL